MKSINKNVMFLASMILTTIVACTKAPKNLTLKAECFITTKGRDNIKMGGVQVVIFDGAMIEFNELYQTYTNVFVPARKAINDFAGWNDLLASTKADVNSESYVMDTLTAAFSGDEVDPNMIKMQKIADYIAWEELKKENSGLPLAMIKNGDNYVSDCKELADTHEKLLEIARNICSYENQLSLIFDEIKDYEITRTRTDAEGKLEIKLPIKESYVIIAQSERLVASEDNPEKYFWIIRTSKPEFADVNEIKIQMSNYNLSNMNEKEPEESTEERLILENPEVGSMANVVAVMRKVGMAKEMENALKLMEN